MPLIINVGVSRKASKDYQSSGCSINLTAELDQALLSDTYRLQSEIQRIYAQAETALDNQQRPVQTSSKQIAPIQGNTVSVTPAQALGTRTRPQFAPALNGMHPPATQLVVEPGTTTVAAPAPAIQMQPSLGGAIRPATDSQHRALRAIAKRLRCDLNFEVHEEFGILLADLDLRQASRFIDLLKQRQEDGRGSA